MIPEALHDALNAPGPGPERLAREIAKAEAQNEALHAEIRRLHRQLALACYAFALLAVSFLLAILANLR